jgi:ankyrin repeat protein
LRSRDQLDEKDVYNRTPLDIAKEKGHDAIIEYLNHYDKPLQKEYTASPLKRVRFF